MDSIANFITQIKNAGDARKESLSVPYSKHIFAIATILEKEGFVSGVEKKGKKVIKTIEMNLVYSGKAPKVQGVKRISKLSKRVYEKSSEIHPVRQGYGMAILSTPKGLLTDREARKEKVGGEVLFKIW